MESMPATYTSVGLEGHTPQQPPLPSRLKTELTFFPSQCRASPPLFQSFVENQTSFGPSDQTPVVCCEVGIPTHVHLPATSRQIAMPMAHPSPSAPNAIFSTCAPPSSVSSWS